MKRLIWVLVAGALIVACQESEPVKSEFTGNESVYALAQGSAYAINGTVSFKERLDGSTSVVVALSGTEGNVEHPVHLHLGDISSPDADVAALLTPVNGVSGVSETKLERLADETPITYAQLISLDACVKIHLSASGPDRDIILAGGNIGAASTREATSGRVGIAVCKSE